MPSAATLIVLNQYPEKVYSPTNTYVSIPRPKDIPHPNKKKNLTFDQNGVVIQMLFQKSKHGLLLKKVISKVAIFFFLYLQVSF